jgi:hypothetical protein
MQKPKKEQIEKAKRFALENSNESADIEAAREYLKYLIEIRQTGGKIGGAKSRGGGRPRKYKTASERQKAYLERKEKPE